MLVRIQGVNFTSGCVKKVLPTFTVLTIFRSPIQIIPEPERIIVIVAASAIRPLLMG